MGTSWTRANLRPASFRGVPFHVDSAGKSFGRAVVTHEYPGKDWAFHEDMGRATRQFPVQALLVGDDVLAQAAAFEAALETPGPGTLIHPWYGTLTVVATGSQRAQWDLREGRVARYTLTFEEDAGTVAAQPAGAADTARAVEGAANLSLGSLLKDAAGALGLDGAVDFVRDDVLGALNEARDAVSDAIGFAGAIIALPDQLLASVMAGVTALVPDQLLGGLGGGVVAGLVSGRTSLGDLVAGRLGAVTALFSSLVPFRSSGSGDGALAAAVPVPIPATAATILPATAPDVAALAAAALPAGTARPVVDAGPALTALLVLAGDGTTANPGWSPTALAPLPAVAATPARRAQAANRQALTVLVRAAAATEAARVAARTDFTSRTEADQARAEVGAALDVAADQAGDLGWDASWRALTDLRAATVRDLTLTAQPLPTLAAYTPGAVLPSAALAHRLYGDDLDALFDRAADLVVRNRVAHPGFMPAAALEVLQWAA